MRSLGNRFDGPVDYSVTNHDQEFFYMVFHMMCAKCGRMVVEETVNGGTMITCLRGDGGCGTRFWVDED